MVSNPNKLLLSAILLALAGCSSMTDTGEVFSDRRVEYRKSQNLERDLEVPPDLTKVTLNDAMRVPETAAGSSATYSEYMQQQQIRQGGTVNAAAAPAKVLPKIDNVDLKQEGDRRWLEISAPVDAVWQKVLGFWQENGILLVEQDPQVGVMLTDWVENRADIKSDVITDAVRKVFDGAYSAGTRDQYRIRLERGKQEGVTELYLTQRGMQEEFAKGTTGESQQSVWVPRATDPGLEAEMLRRLMVYLGISDQQAQASLAQKREAPARAQLHKTDAESFLTLTGGSDDAWRTLGVALDRVGFAVEGREQAQGYYLVRYNDPNHRDEKPGFFAGLFSGKKKEEEESRYRVHLVDQGGSTRVQVESEAGEQLNTDTSIRILTLLSEQLR